MLPQPCSTDGKVATVDGLLLFSKRPARCLSQAGFVQFATRARDPTTPLALTRCCGGLLVALAGDDGEIIEDGLVEQAWDFVRRNTMPTARLHGPRRVDGWDFSGATGLRVRGRAGHGGKDEDDPGNEGSQRDGSRIHRSGTPLYRTPAEDRRGLKPFIYGQRVVCSPA